MTRKARHAKAGRTVMRWHPQQYSGGIERLCLEWKLPQQPGCLLSHWENYEKSHSGRGS
jgi:hypothetical protein